MSFCQNLLFKLKFTFCELSGYAADSKIPISSSDMSLFVDVFIAISIREFQ